MQFGYADTYRELDPDMGIAVAQRTVLRKIENRWENWGEVADRVSLGNWLLDKNAGDPELRDFRAHLANGSILMSGRHLQHGDKTQPGRNLEVFSNCFHGDTKFLTQEFGSVSLSSMAGKTVTIRARDGQWREATVKSFGRQKLQQVVFCSRNGIIGNFPYEVMVTPDHRWFLADGTETTNLEVGDMLESAPEELVTDPEAILHGLIFGDGTANKRRVDYPGACASQGRTYAGVRLCGDKKSWLPLFEGYSVSYPPHADGDPVVYVGKKEFWKDLPFTRDPAYIAGFIKGWWMADGSKHYSATRSGFEISTSDVKAKDWLLEHAPYVGFRVTGMSTHERKEKDGSFDNGTTLWSVRFGSSTSVKVHSIEPLDMGEVFCVVEPVTHGFVLANGLVTGNCSTAALSCFSYYLLLNGSGVGRSYDDDICIVDWSRMPHIHVALSESHKDFQKFTDMECLEDIQHRMGENIILHTVEDTREGWAQALEFVEVLTWEGTHANEHVVLDFSNVRPRNSPIKGMQNRPSAGPVPTMDSFKRLTRLKGCTMPLWKQAMFVDHWFADSVMVGGARRAARMSTKYWRDKDILEFIAIKFKGYDPENPYLWSSNNSVMVDAEFWAEAHVDGTWANKVFNAVTFENYVHERGEPGLINVDKIQGSNKGIGDRSDGKFIGSNRYEPSAKARKLIGKIAKISAAARYNYIVNPCGEIRLHRVGAYCVIADLALVFCDTIMQCCKAARLAARALIRTNTMNSLYGDEVKRTNRIGVGLTGIHEWAWKMFGLGFKDLINEKKSKKFWAAVATIARAVVDEATSYSIELGLAVPDTFLTTKPAGTTSKLFNLSEGAHLPAMREYLRWVQFRFDDPLVAVYEKAGYRIRRDLKSYRDMVIVGFPTKPLICQLGMPAQKLVTAGEATMDQQFQWLRLLEKYWINAGMENATCGNQVSYTMKYDPKIISLEQFRASLLKNQKTVLCAAVMPSGDTSKWDYLPEEPMTLIEYNEYVKEIGVLLEGDVDKAHVDCPGGACPVNFEKKAGDRTTVALMTRSTPKKKKKKKAA